jgi:hypothetical protein
MSYNPQNPNGQAASASSEPVVLSTEQETILSDIKTNTDNLTANPATSTKQSDGSQKTQVVDGSGNVIGATSNALDVNIKSNATALVNQSTNLSQIAGTTTDTNSGNKSAGTQRIVIATDQPQLTNALKVDGSAVTQPVSGSITANAGTNLNTSALALDATLTGGTQLSRITDGTQTANTIAGDSGQNALIVASSRKEVTFNVNSTNSTSWDVSNYAWVSVHTTSYSSGGIGFQISNDNTNWVSLVLNNSASTSSTIANVQMSAAQLWHGPLAGRYFRITGGVGSGTVEFSTIPRTMAANGAAQVSTWSVSTIPTTTGGHSTFHLASAGSTNATVVKASAGQLYGWMITNTTSSFTYLAFHNTASTPTAGSSVFFKIGIPASGGANVEFTNGIAFSSGIAITTVTGAADNNTTAVAANDQIINLFYK